MYLQLENLTKKFGNLLAVNNINISIEKGELVSLVGPSGCGKTTTLKMIGGFLRPTEGRIVLDGVDITNYEPENRPITTVFQNYALFPHMNVYENIGYGLKYRKEYTKSEKKEKTEEIIKLVGLNEFIYQNVTKLSGGQQQRVALARALVLNPKVLLLDEPFSNLDAKLRIKMRNEIKELQEKTNITMIFVTHDQEEALSVSDRIVILNNGIIEQVGIPKEIYMNPTNKFVADFIGRANIIEKEDKTLIIRPESVVIVDEPSEYSGKIIQKQYMGNYTIYFIKIGNDIVQVDISSSITKDYKLDEVVNIKFLDTKILKTI